jgi:hypothetical protein
MCREIAAVFTKKHRHNDRSITLKNKSLPGFFGAQFILAWIFRAQIRSSARQFPSIGKRRPSDLLPYFFGSID